MSNDVLISQYPKQQCVRDRNLNSLLEWANTIVLEEIPATKPEASWVRNRLVAERIPQQADNYVQRTLSYFQQDVTTQTNIRQFLSPWNDETTETSLSQQNGSIILGFMPRFATYDISDQQVQDWYLANGFV